MTTGPECPRCRVQGGAHQEWCTVSRLVERWLTPAPAFDPAALMATVTQAAREAAREAVMEVLGATEIPHLRALPEPAAEVAEVPEASAREDLEGQLAEAVEKATKPSRAHRANAEADERNAAADLFVAEMVTADGAAEDAYITAPQVMECYEAWRWTIEAPSMHPRILGLAMTRAGHADRRRQATRRDPGFAEGPLPVLYKGLRLRVPQAQPTPEAEAETAAPPTERSSTDRKGRTKVSYPSDYSGDRPGREIPREYREQIVMPLISAGWSYYRNNANGMGKPRMVSPEGKRYSLANTPSDWRGLENAKSHLRRYLGASL